MNWKLDELFTQKTTPAGIPVTLIGAELEDTDFGPAVVVWAVTDKNQKLLSYRYTGYPMPGGTLGSFSRLGQFIVRLEELGVPIEKTGDGDLSSQLIRDLDATVAGLRVQVARFEGYLPTWNGRSADRPYRSPITLPVRVLGRISAEELTKLRQAVSGPEPDTAVTSEPDGDDITDLFLHMIHGRTQEEAIALAARNERIRNAPFYPQIRSGTIFRMMRDAGRIRIEGSKMIVPELVESA
jgi:hypothetical protein